MIKKPITIRLSSGLEARPVNAKRIMGMMTLGLDNGEEVTVTANGKDESEAMDGVEKYLSSPFAE